MLLLEATDNSGGDHSENKELQVFLFIGGGLSDRYLGAKPARCAWGGASVTLGHRQPAREVRVLIPARVASHLERASVAVPMCSPSALTRIEARVHSAARISAPSPRG